jgi:hypothetical protein
MKKSWFEANIWLGTALGPWLRLLARNRFAVRPARLPMAALVTIAAAGNSLLAFLQSLRYGRQVSRMSVPDDPIFIIGHWRTGTTMLHELLALDPRHRAPTTYECLSPNHFLITERFVRRFARFLLPRTRPFDNMRMSYDRPQEDECALALRGVPSPFLTVAFPRRPLQDPDYVDLDRLSPRRLAAWQTAFRRFLQLLLFRRTGRLVLKSPQHSNRLPTLIAMFPRARFIYMTRDPYQVFSSTLHFWRTMYQRYGLQAVDEAMLREHVLVEFDHMARRVAATRQLIPPAQFYELRYDRLAANPSAELKQLYAALDLGDLSPMGSALEQYAERSRRYKTNDYAPLDAATAAEVARRWAPWVESCSPSPQA